MSSKPLLALLVLLATTRPAAGGEPGRWQRLAPWAREAIRLRRQVRQLQRDSRVLTAHPRVARRLSDELTKKLGRPVRIPARRIVQVQWGSAEHRLLKAALGSSIGIGIYPSRPAWGHGKLRIGADVADMVPGKSRPFPSTGTRARIVPMDGMHHRFYDAVFAGRPEDVQSLRTAARARVAEKQTSGGSCAAFISRLLRKHLGEVEGTGHAAYGGKLDGFKRGMSAAAQIWRHAAAADPALIVVYTSPWDHRRVSHPEFRFDYSP